MSEQPPQPLRVVITGGTAPERAFLHAQIAAAPSRPEVLEAEASEPPQENLFTRLFRSNPTATLLLRWSDLAIIDVNPAFVEFSGFAAEEMLGRAAKELDLLVDRSEGEELLSRLRATSSLRHADVSFKTKAGERRLSTGFFERVEIEGVDYLLCMIVDLSERDRAANEIRKLATFPELNPNPVLEFAAAGQLTYCNRAAVSLAQSVGFESVEQMLPAEHGEIVGECLATQQPRLRHETRHRQRTLSWSFYPIVPQGVVHCYVGDITEKLQLEEQIRQAQKMEAVGQLAGGVAHDFNNLLTIIQMQISMLRMRGGLSNETATGIDEIANAAERATNLTRQLLTFSRRQVKAAKNLDPGDLVGGMTKLLRRVLGEDVILESRFAPELPVVFADPGMLEQVLMNLAVNARDAMPRGGRLLIELDARAFTEAQARRHPEARAGEFVCLSVSDTGVGIAPENIVRIFEPFFTTKEVGKGTGLGLAIVYAIVRQHEGWIEVESAVGRGTSFRVFLPALVRKQQGVTEGEAGGGEQLPGGCETILVVEDEVAVRAVARMALRRLGYTVLEADNAQAALRLWSELGGRVDLLFTDIVMPGGMSGHELAARLQLQKPELKILFCSGYTREAEAFEPGDGRSASFLPKPYKAGELALAVRRVFAAQTV
ncbi:MAG TPA: ATP-binding protein [Opitutaceae bacterium]|nr:ATP-binding protein [Opitutaceae bacterium]